jgi:hypothetical protein
MNVIKLTQDENVEIQRVLKDLPWHKVYWIMDKLEAAVHEEITKPVGVKKAVKKTVKKGKK